MVNSGKCPKCEKTVTGVKIENVPASVNLSSGSFKAISFCCKFCHTVLSVFRMRSFAGITRLRLARFVGHANAGTKAGQAAAKNGNGDWRR